MGDLGPQEPALDAAVFDLTRFEAVHGRLELEGTWRGVGGTRFVRPTLIVEAAGETHRLLASLDHKPWEPADGAPWVAAFPCEVDDVDAAELSVASEIEVELPAPTKPGKKPSGAAQMKRRPGKRVPAAPNGDGDTLVRAARLERERDEAVEQRQALARELEALKQSLQETVSEARVQEREAAATALAEGAGLRSRVEEERAEALMLRDAAFRDRDAALAARVHAEEERAQAVAERKTAERERDKGVKEAERQRDRAVKEAERERDRAVKESAQARAERDEAVAERDRACAERDAARHELDALVSAHERGLPLREPQPRFGPAEPSRNAVDVWLARAVAGVILLILVLVVLSLF